MHSISQEKAKRDVNTMMETRKMTNDKAQFQVSNAVVDEVYKRTPGRPGPVGKEGFEVRENRLFRAVLEDKIDVAIGYGAVLLYVRKGLGLPRIIGPVVDFIVDAQKDVTRQWPLIPFSYGWEDGFKFPQASFQMGISNNERKKKLITSTICELAGDLVEPGEFVFQKLYPFQNGKPICRRKTSLKLIDLLMVVDFEGNPVFDADLKQKLGMQMRKSMVFVRVFPGLDGAEWRVGKDEVVFVKSE